MWCPLTSREYTEILAVLFTHQHNPTSHKGCKGASDICVHMCTIKGEESSTLVKTAIYNRPDVPVNLLDYCLFKKACRPVIKISDKCLLSPTM